MQIMHATFDSKLEGRHIQAMGILISIAINSLHISIYPVSCLGNLYDGLELMG